MRAQIDQVARRSPKDLSDETCCASTLSSSCSSSKVGTLVISLCIHKRSSFGAADLLQNSMHICNTAWKAR